MCVAITVFNNGVRIPCGQTDERLCYYHNKMADGLIAPLDESWMRPTQVLVGGREIWAGAKPSAKFKVVDG